MQQEEIIRYAVRRHLYDRPTVSQDAATIHRHVSRHEVCTVEEVAVSLRFLEGLGEVESHPDPLGSTRYYTITAAGTLAEERS